ncbi:MAG TPA: hypothetical protein VFH53_05830 [Phycisphaerae bacterium]|nr:hypothetical protein [Phycisphaerae bacterium]
MADRKKSGCLTKLLALLLFGGLAVWGIKSCGDHVFAPETPEQAEKRRQEEAEQAEKRGVGAEAAKTRLERSMGEPNGPLPEHTVLDVKSHDTPIKTQVEVHAVVAGTITKESLERLLLELYSKAESVKSFKHHGGRATHVFVYLYTSREHFESGMGQWIAMLSKVGSDASPEMCVESELISQLGAAPETRYGISEAKRKEIFKAIVVAEDRATEEAERLHPMPDPLKAGFSQAKAKAQFEKQAETNQRLVEEYKAELAKQYGLTKEQLQEISVEGIEENWPMPSRKSAVEG